MAGSGGGGGGGGVTGVWGMQGVIEGVGLNNPGSSNHSGTHHSTFLVHTPPLSPQTNHFYAFIKHRVMLGWSCSCLSTVVSFHVKENHQLHKGKCHVRRVAGPSSGSSYYYTFIYIPVHLFGKSLESSGDFSMRCQCLMSSFLRRYVGKCGVYAVMTFAFMHHPYLVCILFGMPSLDLFTFVMFFSFLVSILFWCQSQLQLDLTLRRVFLCTPL